MRLTKKEDYALLILSVVFNNTKNKKRIKLKEISQSTGIPLAFSRKIVSYLKKGGLLSSKEGINGGYLLKKDPKDISMRDIFISLEKNLSLTDCFLGSCKYSTICNSAKIINKINREIISKFEEIKLTEIL
jgi:Rrf2 family protein